MLDFFSDLFDFSSASSIVKNISTTNQYEQQYTYAPQTTYAPVTTVTPSQALNLSPQYNPIFNIGSPGATAQAGGAVTPTVSPEVTIIPTQTIIPTVAPTQTQAATTTQEGKAEATSDIGGGGLMETMALLAVVGIGGFVVWKIMTSKEGKARVKRSAKKGTKAAGYAAKATLL